MNEKPLKASIPLEKQVQNSICEWLYYNKYFFWRSNNVPVFSRNNGGRMSFRSMPKYSPKGLPDIIVIFQGKFIGIEVKRAKNYKISDDQVAFGAKTIENGGHYYVVHSLEEFLGIKQLYLG